MSYGGHVSDMISRLKNNREWHNIRKERHQKIMEAYQKHHPHAENMNSEEGDENNHTKDIEITNQ